MKSAIIEYCGLQLADWTGWAIDSRHTAPIQLNGTTANSLTLLKSNNAHVSPRPSLVLGVAQQDSPFTRFGAAVD
jgi:hypothetical protein